MSHLKKKKLTNRYEFVKKKFSAIEKITKPLRVFFPKSSGILNNRLRSLTKVITLKSAYKSSNKIIVKANETGNINNKRAKTEEQKHINTQLQISNNVKEHRRPSLFAKSLNKLSAGLNFLPDERKINNLNEVINHEEVGENPSNVELLPDNNNLNIKFHAIANARRKSWAFGKSKKKKSTLTRRISREAEDKDEIFQEVVIRAQEQSLEVKNTENKENLNTPRISTSTRPSDNSLAKSLKDSRNSSLLQDKISPLSYCEEDTVSFKSCHSTTDQTLTSCLNSSESESDSDSDSDHENNLNLTKLTSKKPSFRSKSKNSQTSQNSQNSRNSKIPFPARLQS